MRSISTILTVAAAALSLLAVACGGDDDGMTKLYGAECNPLGGTACITPWPSSIYEVEDTSTASGMRLDIAEGALPTSTDDRTIASAPYNTRDGFSPAAPILTAFPGGVNPSNLVHYEDYGASLTDASPTVLINMDTGERVVHFAELDTPAAATPDRQALYIRPAARLEGSTRYAVGIRKSLKARDGTELPISAGFQSILDGDESDHDLLERVRPRYTEIFAAFTAAGIDREDLVVAWDFTTASDESLRVDVLTARDAGIIAMGDAGANLTFTVTRDEAEGDAAIARRIEGTFTAPLFLTNAGAFNFETTLARDAAGLPLQQGMYDVPFVAIVPECALLAENQPVPMMIYGHGLLGTAGQVSSGSQRLAAGELCVVIAGTDMRGMSQDDIGSVVSTLNDLNKAPSFFPLLIQGVVNHVALQHIMRGPMAADLFVDGDDNSIVDPTDLVYYGNSQGGIFGTTFMAYDTFVERGVLGVPAINYSMMLERSSDWPTYGVILAGAYQDPLLISIALNLMQMNWDPTDPVGSANDLLTGGIPGTPSKQVLLHMAVGDHQVPNIATEYQARTMGIGTLQPSAYEPYGLPEAAGPLDSALVIWDGGHGVGILPTNEPPVGTEDPHGMPRSEMAAIRQMASFYARGEIIATCGDGETTTACFCTEDENNACD